MSSDDLISGQRQADRYSVEMDQMTAKTFEKVAQQDIKQDQSLESLIDLVDNSEHVFEEKTREKRKEITDRQKEIREAEISKTQVQKGDQSEKQLKDTAKQFETRNPELKQKMLMLLRKYLKQGDSKDEILRKVKEFYEDVSIIDEAMDFLEETTGGELKEAVKEAKEELNKNSQREIAAGRNIASQARKFAEKGLGSPNALRDMYRDITGNPRDSRQLFQELSGRFKFAELRKVCDFLFHSLGADLKAKGPSISHAFLSRLMTECRSLQAILGVYNFFRGRMGLVRKLFTQNGLQMPQQLTFESIAKQFMSLIGERYPSADKVLKLALKLGIEKMLVAKIIIFSQMRDGIREVALNQIFQSVQNRDDMLAAILEALDELEDELDEIKEREEEEGEPEFEEAEEEEEEPVEEVEEE